jgi:hypothetical protein
MTTGGRNCEAPRCFARGFTNDFCSSAVLLVLLVLLATLLLLLPGFLLPTTLLLTALLLLAGLLVWILIHFPLQYFNAPFDRSSSMARVNPRPLHSFPIPH